MQLCSNLYLCLGARTWTFGTHSDNRVLGCEYVLHTNMLTTVLLILMASRWYLHFDGNVLYNYEVMALFVLFDLVLIWFSCKSLELLSLNLKDINLVYFNSCFILKKKGGITKMCFYEFPPCHGFHYHYLGWSWLYQHKILKEQ